MARRALGGDCEFLAEPLEGDGKSGYGHSFFVKRDGVFVCCKYKISSLGYREGGSQMSRSLSIPKEDRDTAFVAFVQQVLKRRGLWF